jgi:hypothetical protein
MASMHIVIVASAKAVAAGQIYEMVILILENLGRSYSQYNREPGWLGVREAYLG